VRARSRAVAGTCGPCALRYGWEILAADAASLLVSVIGSGADRSDSGAFAFVGLFGYVAAPPVVHLFHHQSGRALASMGMRLGLPVLGVVVGVAASSGCEDDGEFDFCQLGWGAVGLLVGTASAIVTDVALAREPVPRASAGLQLIPQVLVSEREARIGLAGSF
jgi:hypothetical protein